MSELRMPAINQVSLAGRLVQDPEFRIAENGAARLNGRIAVNRSYRDQEGEWQEISSFFNIVIWQKLAEYCADRIHKGTPVIVSGRLRSHSWKDAENNPHTIVEVQVRSLQVLEKVGDMAAAESDEEEESEEEDLPPPQKRPAAGMFFLK